MYVKILSNKKSARCKFVVTSPQYFCYSGIPIDLIISIAIYLLPISKQHVSFYSGRHSIKVVCSCPKLPCM